MNAFIPSLVSITFRSLSPERLAELAARSGLQAIEWGGDVHAPHGDAAAAERCRRAGTAHGLEACAYGSYYRLGISPAQGLEFATVLESARRLDAPRIRVWVGVRGSAETPEAERQRIIDDARRCADRAAAAGRLVFSEWHGNTLTDTLASGLAFLEALNHPAFRTAWQPPVGLGDDACVEELRRVLPHLEHLHVFHWQPERERRPLAEGAARWTRFFAEAARAARPLYAALEFVRADDPAHLPADAATLRALCGLP